MVIFLRCWQEPQNAPKLKLVSNEVSHYQDHPNDSGFSQTQYTPLYDFVELERREDLGVD